MVATPAWAYPVSARASPGSTPRCWYCGRQYVWGGNGMTKNLMCNGSREWRCWNSVGFDGALAARRLVEAITTHLYRLDGFEEQFQQLVRRAREEEAKDPARRWDKWKQENDALARQRENLLAAVAAYGPKPMFEQKLAEMEALERRQNKERRELENLSNRSHQLPESITGLRCVLEEQFQRLVIDSSEFGDLMRRLAPQYHVYLVRLCDGGHLLPRARVTLVLGGDVPGVCHVPGLPEMLTMNATLDLFDCPPQRERIRDEAVRLAAQGVDQRQIAARLPEKATQAAVQRALALDRMMRASGAVTPYAPLLEPPADYSKLCRHRNSKYQFSSLAGVFRTLGETREMGANRTPCCGAKTCWLVRHTLLFHQECGRPPSRIRAARDLRAANQSRTVIPAPEIPGLFFAPHRRLR